MIELEEIKKTPVLNGIVSGYVNNLVQCKATRLEKCYRY
jgi:hypothetical protein